MLKINIQRILAGRAIDRPYTYFIKQGFSKNLAARLNTGKMKQMKLANIEKLCLLFQCTPNELLEWVPAEKENDVETQPLRDLIRVNPKVNIRAVLNALPYAQIVEMEKIISEKVKKPDEK
jgi:DNA-binding Xre family transcriptional regulator